MTEATCTRCGGAGVTAWGLSHSPDGEQFCQNCLDNHHGRY